MRKRVQSFAVIALLAAAFAAAEMDVSWIQSAGPIADPAGVLAPADRERIESVLATCRTELGVPLRVAAIPSLAEHGGAGMQTATYADLLLEALQSELAGSTEEREKALLLLLVVEDRSLSIALGNGWDTDFFTASRRLVKEAETAIAGQNPPGPVLASVVSDLEQAIRQSQRQGMNPILLYGAGLAMLGVILAAGAVLIWRGGLGTGPSGLQDAVLDRSNTQIRQKLRRGADPDAFDEHGYTAAIYAAGQGDLQTLEVLHDHGADLGLATEQGETPLYSACHNGHARVAAYLLSKGVPVDPRTVHNETPLLIAAREGHLEIVAGLLHAGADVNGQDNRGWGALMIALRESHEDVVNLLLNHNVDVNLAPKDGPNALMMAVKEEDEALVRRLVEQGADVHHQARDGMCALRIAVLRGNQPIARRLLNAGANVSAPFSNKEKPAEMAERQGHGELAAYLRKREKRLAACMDILEVVARGDVDRLKEIVVQVPGSVNVHSKKTRWTPLLVAVRAGQHGLASILIEHGADVHARSKEGKPAIAYAVDAGDLAMVKILLGGGARIDQIDAEGTDLRTYAKAQGQNEIVAFATSFVAQQAAGYELFKAVTEDDPPHALTILKENPGCVDARTRHERWTPLLQAARNGNQGMAKLLLEYHAQPNLCNSRGMSPLMYAARGGDLELVRLLLSHGADARLKSKEGNTACEFALNSGHARVVMLLQEVEAQLDDLSKAGFPAGGEADAEAGEENGRALDIFQAVQDNDARRLKQVLHYWPESVRLRWGPSELTPLHMAVGAGNHELARQLMEAGADVNAPNREGRTPLHQAVGRADAALVDLLIESHADAGVKAQGISPLQAAEAAGYDDIVELLDRTRNDNDS